ncbi:MAG: hypothetical protein RLY43_104 [Bacteroidota bacterium]|jgi:hypothetical protein
MEKDNLIYGVVVNGMLYSNKIETKLRKQFDNGIYEINMSHDNFIDTLSPASLDDARRYFRKASKISVIRGISFHDGIIPENPVAYKKFPIKVTDATYDELEEIEVAIIKNVCYFIQAVCSDKTYTLMDLNQALNDKDNKVYPDINKIKGITPEVRIAYTFHLLEKRKKEMEEPIEVIKSLMATNGAEIEFVKKNNRGFEVQWSANGHTINTLLDKNFRVTEAGFCTSGYDSTQSAGSIVNLLKDYSDRRVSSRDYVNVTRTVK